MKKIFIIIIFMFNIIYAQVYNPTNLEFSISMDKDTFLVDEKIHVEFKVKNISNEPTYISFPLSRFMEFRVTDLDNNGFPGICFHGEGNYYSHYLNSGEELTRVENVMSLRGNKDKKHGPFYYFKEGNYKITAKYSPTEFLQFDFEKKFANAIKNKMEKTDLVEYLKSINVIRTGKDTLNANILYFTVIEPKDVEIEVQKGYLNAMKYYFNHLQDNDKGVIPGKILSNLIRKYPNSKYLETIVHTSLNIGNNDMDMEFVLEKFKNSISSKNLMYKNITIVKSLSKNKSNKVENEKENMHYFINKYKKTKIEKYAKVKLLESELMQNRRNK